MLVAVAAMAFVACSQDNDSINILAKKTVLHFNAGFADDTRSSFVEKEDGATSYKSVWNGGEQLIISICDSEGKEIGSAYAYVSLDEGVESAESMHFSAEYGGTIPENGSITVYSGNWYPDYSGKYVPYFDSYQYGATDYSVASNFHICKSNTVEFTNGLPATIDLTFSTAVAFGKVTMSQFSDVADKIEEVKVTINDNTTYTVTPATLTKPVVWFAAEAVEAVTKLSIEAKVDGVTYVKTAENLNTSFETGLVRPINVSAMTEKPADYNIEFTKMVFEGDAQNGGYLYTFTNESDSESMSLAFNPAYGNPLQAGTYECCFWFNGDNYDFNGNDSILSIDGENYYPTVGSKIIVELNESVYTIKANLVVGEKTAVCTFTGEISEPELPTFTSATYNGNASDKIIKLSGEELGELWINLYGSANPLITSDNWINVGQYSIDNGLYFGTDYGQYKPAGYSEWCTVKPSSFTLDVSIVDGQYMFVVNADYSTWKEGVALIDATYHGDIEGLDYPDLRTQLATPEPTLVQQDGKTATISWEPIPGAVAYHVFTQNNVIDKTTTETSITLNFEEYGEYYINVKAVAATDDATYRDSDAGYIRVFIEDTRVRLELSNVSATASGNTVTISWDRVEGAGSYTVTFNGNTQDTTNTEVVFTELEYNSEYYYNIVANPANEETHQASNAYSGYVTTERDPNVGFDYDITFTSCKAGAGNTYTFTTDDGSYEWKLKLQNKLAVGSFVNEQWNNAHWDGNNTKFSYPGMPYAAYIYNGTLDISLDGEIYTITLVSYDNFENGVKFTYTGTIEEYVSTGIDLSDYTELKDVTVTWYSSSVEFRSSSPYSFSMNLYGVYNSLTEGTYLATGVPTFDSASLEGFSAGDDRVANVYLNDDGSYTITAEGTFSYAGYMKVYFTITL